MTRKLNTFPAVRMHTVEEENRGRKERKGRENERKKERKREPNLTQAPREGVDALVVERVWRDNGGKPVGVSMQWP